MKDNSSRYIIWTAIAFSSLACFALQFNLPLIFGNLNSPWTVVRLVPYFFLGCALSPLLLWSFRHFQISGALPWLPPIVLTMGVPLAMSGPSLAESAIFILLVFGSINAVLLQTLFQHSFKENYLFDLLGGVAGFLVAIYLVNQLTGEGVYLISVVASVVPAILLSTRLSTKIAGVIALFLAGSALAAQLRANTFDLLQLPSERRPRDLVASQLLQNKSNTRLLGTEWSAISRVDAIRFNGQAILFSNNRIWSQISPYPPGSNNKFNVASPFWEGAKTAAVIGIGGGNDLRALIDTEVPDITGIEVNPATLKLMNKLGEENGYIYSRAKIVLSEGRAFIESTDKKYDLILMSDADLWSPQMQANVDIESFLYTEEAIATFWNHMSPNGTLMVQFNLPKRIIFGFNSVRLMNTLLNFLDKKQLPAKEHLMVFSHAVGSWNFRPKKSMFVLKKAPQTEAMIAAYRKKMATADGILWLSDPAPIPQDSLQIEQCLQSTFHNQSICPRHPSLITTDSYPFYNMSSHYYLRILGTEYFIPLFAALLLICIYGMYSRRRDSRMNGRIFFTTLISGIIYGFLSPYLYYQFLLYSRLPLAVLAFVQIGLLAASILSNQLYDACKSKKLIGILLAVSVSLISLLPIFRTSVIAFFRPSEGLYALIIFAIVILIAFPLGLVFQSIIRYNQTQGPLAFGINMTGLCLGSFVSFLVSLEWGLHATSAVLVILVAIVLVSELASAKIKEA